MEVLCGYHHNLFIVGDPDQTVYTWRGANVKYLTDFDRAFPGVKTVMMMQNYRSAPHILRLANSLIDKNRGRIKKELIPTLPEGDPVICHHGANSEEEAEWIAGQIASLAEGGVSLKDITVLYRAHYVTRTVEDALLKAKIPYTIYSGAPFFERTEIKDALSYLRLVAYRDDLSFLRVANVPKRNLGDRRMGYLKEYAEREGCTLYDALVRCAEEDLFRGTKARELISLVDRLSDGYGERPISELLAAVLNESGYEKMLRTEGAQNRLDNLAELRQSVYEYETSCGEEAMLEHYLAHVAMFTNADADEGGDRVKLMTVHTAKGLEFPYVFLCAMNEGIFPSKKTSTLQEMEEERRLAFVAVTRAKKRLYLSEAEGRNFDGTPRYPSRFLLDVDPDLLEHTSKPRDGLIAEAREYIAVTDGRLRETSEEELFAVGQRVRHAIFGVGTVTDVDREKSAYGVKFDNMETPRRIAFRVVMKKAE